MPIPFKLLALVKELNLDEKTLVVFSSDNRLTGRRAGMNFFRLHTLTSRPWQLRFRMASTNAE